MRRLRYRWRWLWWSRWICVKAKETPKVRQRFIKLILNRYKQLNDSFARDMDAVCHLIEEVKDPRTHGTATIQGITIQRINANDFTNSHYRITLPYSPVISI